MFKEFPGTFFFKSFLTQETLEILFFSKLFKKISWDEALNLAVEWLKPLRKKAPEKLAFFTGRDQSQSFTSYFAQMFGTPNYAAHGGFCSVNMATAGIYTMGGSFWEFGQPDWDYTKLFILFGVAEDHDSNPIKMGIGKIKEREQRSLVLIRFVLDTTL